jgi:2-pyrone-4,6-dicarboxylate lactonase
MSGVDAHMRVGAWPHFCGSEHEHAITPQWGRSDDDLFILYTGGYRLLKPDSRYDDIAPYTRALCDAAPTRTIWGSDWPNVALFDSWQLPETGAQLDALKKHIGSEEKLHAVLVENPERLFGLPGTAVRAPQ